MKASLLHRSGCYLGEGSVWHPERKSFFWVDIENCTIYEFAWPDGNVQQWKLDRRVSLVVPSSNDALILGLQGGVGRFNLLTHELSWISDLGRNWDDHRCNDGACDSKGRLWVGTMQLDEKKGAASLYCITEDLTVDKKLSNVSISNGLAWSPDNTRMYYIDSPSRVVAAFLFDEQSGDITFEKIAARIPDDKGFPDGMAIDAEGMLWIALWGGSGVGRWDPASGRMIDFVEVAAPQVSCCAFGGKDLDQLFITTARKGMNDKALAKYKGSGNIFIAQPGVKGIPDNKCRLSVDN